MTKLFSEHDEERVGQESSLINWNRFENESSICFMKLQVMKDTENTVARQMESCRYDVCVYNTCSQSDKHRLNIGTWCVYFLGVMHRTSWATPIEKSYIAGIPLVHFHPNTIRPDERMYSRS